MEEIERAAYCERILAEIDAEEEDETKVSLAQTRLNSISFDSRLRVFQRLLTTPRRAPEPGLIQGMDSDLILHAVRQVLVEVGERVWVVRESLVLASKSISSGDLKR